MLPKMQILDKKDYDKKFSLAMLYSDNGEHQNALNLLLELKNKRWKNFDLQYQIALQYNFLYQQDQAEAELNLANPIESNQLLKKETLIDFIKLTRLFPKNYDEKIFQRTSKLQDNCKMVEGNKEKVFEKILAIKKEYRYFQYCSVYYELGHTLTNNKLLKQIFGMNLECINSYSEQEQLKFILMFIRSEDYIHNIEILNQLKQLNKHDIINYAQGYCFQQIKKYKEALYYYTISNKQQFSLDYKLSLYYMWYLMQTQVEQSKNIDAIQNQLIYFQMVYHNFQDSLIQIDINCQMFSKNDLLQYIKILKQRILISNNTKIYLYYQLFFAEFEFNKDAPNLQKICNHMKTYSPYFAGGYQCQYTLYNYQQKKEKFSELIDPLILCEDCSLKYITLAKIYMEQQKYQLAHQSLNWSMQINKFNSEIQLLRIELYQLQGKYQLAQQTMKSVIELENQNYIFVIQILARLINKYQYYLVDKLLNLTDKENKKFQEFKTFFKILTLNRLNQNDNQLLNEIEQLDTQKQLLFYGHYWFRKNQMQQALQFYTLCFQVQGIEQSQFNYIQQKLTNQIQQYEIIDIICQMSFTNYQYQINGSYLFNRYIETLGFVLSLFLYTEQQDEIVEYINNNFDIEVHKIEYFSNILLKNIQRIYHINIELEKYFMYMTRSLQQLFSLFQSFDKFIIDFFSFCNQNRENILKSIIEGQDQPHGFDTDIQIFYDIPIFSDPISRCAIFKVVKIIGYFNHFELENDYKKTQEWLEFYLLAPHIDEYFEAISQQ